MAKPRCGGDLAVSCSPSLRSVGRTDIARRGGVLQSLWQCPRERIASVLTNESVRTVALSLACGFASVCGSRNSPSSLSLGEFRPQHSLVPRCIPLCRNFFGFAKQNAACLRRQEKCYMDFAAGECPAFGNATFRGSIPPSPKEKAPNGAFFFWWSRKVGKVSENVPLWWRA